MARGNHNGSDAWTARGARAIRKGETAMPGPFLGDKRANTGIYRDDPDPSPARRLPLTAESSALDGSNPTIRSEW